MKTPTYDHKKLVDILAHSLKSDENGLKAANILNAALSAVDPYSAVKTTIDNSDFINSNLFRDDNQSETGKIKVVGAGKAGQPMLEAIQEEFPGRISSGVVVVKDGYAKVPHISEGIRIIEAGHPIPDQRGLEAAHQIIDLLESSTADDLIICLISGGASALLVSPVPGVTLEDMQQMTELLLASGANINEINTLRKHLDQVKGGQLARLAAPARMLCFVLSDVVGDRLEVIGSGPTVPDPSTYRESIEILDRYHILDKVPDTIRTHLEAGLMGQIEETPKPGAAFFKHVDNLIVGSNSNAAHSAVLQARKEGFNPISLTNYLQGEASQAGKFLGSILRQMALQDQPVPRPGLAIVGGETTVTIRGNGLGGRNQELALAAVSYLDRLQDVALITLATDGGDGPTDAAGAVVTGDSLSRADLLNLNPLEYLSNNDSYNFFLPLDDLLRIGPTMTNVNDLNFLFTF